MSGHPPPWPLVAGSSRGRPLHMVRRLALLLAGVALFALSLVLARFPGVEETVWGGRIAPFVTWLLSRATGVFPFALIEILFAAWLAWRITCVARAAREVLREHGPWRSAVAAFVLVLLQDVGVGMAVFYAAWGLAYARPPVESRLEWSTKDLPANLAARLAAEQVEAANDAYRELNGTEDLGRPTPPGDLQTLDAALEDGWRRGAESLGLGGSVLRRYGRVKTLWISPLMHRAGLSGFYAPFTGEANVNRSVPGVSLPHVIAHEKAHQRAIAPEDEANFFGYWAAACSPDPRARYSAHVFAQRQFLRVLLASDREAAEALVAKRLPGVQRDVDDLNAYWEVARGTAGRMTRAMNDAYLKTNRVEGGVEAYGGSVELLMRFARERGGTLATPDASPGARVPSRKAARG